MNSRRLWMIGCAAALAAAAAWAQLQKGEAFTGFRVPDYDEQGQLKMLVQGEKAWIVADDEIEIQNFQIETYQNGVV
ncbi:MAG: hypothetical protein KBA51_03350, partial [Kiritimatiellae bacterium]|nr:hypothetical protein [Kiritimatiellia bacterium]